MCGCVQVSFIQYAKPFEIKRGINDQFSDTFPHIKITLSKLRRIKKDICNIAKEVRMMCESVCWSCADQTSRVGQTLLKGMSGDCL